MNVRAVLATALVLSQSTSIVNAHIALFHPSMWGFNTNADTPTPVGGDNRPVIPLMDRTFKDWWFHGLLGDPPAKDAIFQMPVGQTTMVETVCDKGASSYWNTSAGHTNVQTGDQNYPCPGYPLSQFHTNGIDDLGGCALSIAYKSDVNDVTPDDFVIFSVQHQCVWTRWTAFDVPADMPPCPNGKCICSWHWIHNPDSGSEQMYMTGFQCNMKGATGTKALGKPKLPRYCGADPAKGKVAAPNNCTYGAKSPMWWLQAEGNNMFEDGMDAPTYNDRYHFTNGAQNDIFGDQPTSSYPPTSTPPVNVANVQIPNPSSSLTPPEHHDELSYKPSNHHDQHKAKPTGKKNGHDHKHDDHKHNDHKHGDHKHGSDKGHPKRSDGSSHRKRFGSWSHRH